VDELAKQAQNGELNRSEAAAKVYNVKNSDVAKSMGSRTFTKDNVRKAFLVELENLGLDNKLSISTHRQTFNAIKRQLDPDGGYTEVPDYATRLRAVDLYYKVKGLYPDKQTTTHSLNVYADLPPQQLEAEESAIEQRVKSLEESTEG